MNFSPADAGYMAQALRLAEKGLYTTSPNPRVGAVLVSAEGEVVGEGWHRRAGGAHAEIEALQRVEQQEGDLARGATCYVTLEPCNHQGQTGPCTEALIEAGVARVVYGHEDPNPEVAGSGIDRLRAAGIRVDGPLMEREARALNPGFIRRMATGRPMIRIKMAMSLDGRTAMPDGNSFWITGPRARADVQRLRGRSCAIISGRVTVEKDWASLTVRPQEFEIEEFGLGERQPLRVILDSRGQISPELPFFRQSAPALIVTAQDNPDAVAGCETIGFPGDGGQVDLQALMAELARRGCNEVLVEAGATLASAFLRQGLVDEVVVYVAAKLMGSESRPLFYLPFTDMEESLPLRFSECRAIGRDLRITAIPELE